MTLEAVLAVVLAAAALWLVLHPLFGPFAAPAPGGEPIDPEETAKGVALAALKEIEFDRETGKLSDTDYEFLKAKYTAAALEALRVDRGASDDLEAMIAARVRTIRSAPGPKPSNAVLPICTSCGPRPEADAVFCSSCGEQLVGSQESRVGSRPVAEIPPRSRVQSAPDRDAGLPTPD